MYRIIVDEGLLEGWGWLCLGQGLRKEDGCLMTAGGDAGPGLIETGPKTGFAQ